MELIEHLKYRLNSREILIEKLQNAATKAGEIPRIEQIDTALDNVTTDQISTHFDSYFGFLTASFGNSIDKENILSPISDYIKDKYKQNFIPSYRAISQNFYHKNLLVCSETEISKAFPNIHKSPIITTTELTDTYSATNEENIEQSNKHNIINKFKNHIKSRTDLNKLPEKDKAEIIEQFKSPSVFLKALKDCQHD